MTSNHFSIQELEDLGFSQIGENVSIDRSVRFFGDLSKMSIGDSVRIDAFCLISIGVSGIQLGNYIHIAAGCYLFGSGGRIVMDDFSGLSSRVSIYTSSDDYVQGHLTNPTVDRRFRQLKNGDVILMKHVIIGASSVILPNVTLNLGASVGALTLVRKDVEAGCIITGNPSKPFPTKRNLEQLQLFEHEFLARQRETRQ